MRNGTPSAVEVLDRLVQPVERARPVGDRDDLDAPVGGALAVGRVDAQDQLGPRGDGRGDLDRVEAVDRDADARDRGAPRPRRRRRPRVARVAAQVDHGRPPRAANRSACARSSSRVEPRGVVDLGEDLDVERAVALAAASSAWPK